VRRTRRRRYATHTGHPNPEVACPAIRILQTPEELRLALVRAARFDEHTSDVLRTRSERYRALQWDASSAVIPAHVPDALGPDDHAPGIATTARIAPKATDSSSQDAGAGQSQVAIQLYADLWCPFAHVSLRTVRSLRDKLSLNVPILVRAWPLELVNGVPLDPAVTASHVAELRRDIAPELFGGFRPEVLPRSTMKALALVEAVNDVDPWFGERISLDLRDILFEQGQRLDVDMLRLLAAEAGLDPSVLDDRARVDARLAEGRRLGVQGSPHVFVNGSGFFCPLLDIEKDPSGGLHIHERLERLEQLLLHAVPSSEG
jgi:predicted DsbA family dithiol-disulfide isomerase